MSCVTSCAKCCRVPLKPNLEHYSTTAKKPALFVSPLKKWATHRPPLPWQPTTIPPAASPPTPSNRSDPKPVDMRFYWIRDRVRQGQFQVYWSKGQTNRADYFSKHHPASHHRAIRSTYLYSPTNPTKNYFECLADTMPTPPARANHTVDPGEGVLLSPGYPGCRCDVITDVTRPIARATHISSS